MAEKPQFFDVWIVESNTVYKQVPYTVVTDWVQQGRLLDDDKFKPSTSKDWTRIADAPSFKAFAPKSERFRSEDASEALEPVEVEFAWKKPHSEEDDDVDMIPLIDVSLVLLIFFMMTAAVATSGASGGINTPEAIEGYNMTTEPLWIGLTQDKAGVPTYSLGQGPKSFGSKLTNLTEALTLLDDQLAAVSIPVDVVIRGDKDLPVGVVKQLRAEVELRKIRGKVRKVGDGITERLSK